MTLRSIRSAAIVALTAGVLFALGTIPSPAAQAACPDGGYTSTPGERIMGPNNATVSAQDGHGSYYFVEPYGTTVRYRGIPSVAVYDKYNFRWDTPAYTDPSWIASHLGAPWT
jgi:hypothetical protein